MEDIQLAQNVDISKITFGDIKELKNGGKIVPILYEGKNRLVIQLPEMNAPFGINKYDKEGPVKYDYSVSLRGAEERPSVQATQALAENLDRMVLEEAFKKSKAWFKRTYKSIDVIEPLLTPMLKFSKDKEGNINDKYPPTLKMSIPFKDDKIKIPCYNKDAELVNLIDTTDKEGNIITAIKTKGAAVTGIVQLGSVWVVGPKFGIKLNAVQLRVVEPTGITGYAIIDNSNDRLKDVSDKEDNDSDEEVSQKDKPTVNIENSDEDDDDDDDDDNADDDDDDDVAESTSTPLKKVSKK